jgi:hypothetical protein
MMPQTSDEQANRKKRTASLSPADNKALSKRVKGIEPSPEAWENVCQ